tara:strand:- start:61 stop:1305 length:1245 start_codon:yes stop_codon:yes gene_type:complete
MSLATAWAIRGQFGHEQGAAWAGGIGGLAIVLLAKRNDWYSKTLHLSLASAAGWGIGGIISYGMVVGYGHGSDFGNVYYGLSMLFVIGSLFGLIGGGLFGLVLSETKHIRIQWPQLITEMTVGAFLFYFLLIDQFGWQMTPPRSDAWAGCLGMTVAMFWYMIRNQHYGAIRVAIFAGVGGGFGFAFGNFLQVLGNVSEIHFNFWNVMEYSIGFFGALGMSYGVFTTTWEKSEVDTTRNTILAPLVLITLIIPLMVWDQSFGTQRVSEMVTNLKPQSDIVLITRVIQVFALLLILSSAGYWLFLLYFKNKTEAFSIGYVSIKKLFLGQLGIYTIFSILITGAFMSTYRIEQYLYVVNLVIIGFLIDKFHAEFSDRGLNISRWAINLIFILAIIALLTAVAVSSHDPFPKEQRRFE